MMDAPTSGGGIELHRAMEYERAAAIFHLLIRLSQNPTARVTIETYEDATITSPNGMGGEMIEDIQCKKIEDSKERPASLGMSDWWSAQLTKEEFKKWLETARRGDSSIGRLAKAPNRYFTLLAYAEPSKSVKKYIPPGVVEGGFTRSPATTEYFSLDFSFANDPDPNSSLGSSAVRRRLRTVFLGPPQLHTSADILLHKFYGVMRSKTPDAFRAVEHLFYGHLSRDPEKRTFALSDVETAIKPFRLGSGKWTDVSALMAAEQQSAAAAKLRDIPFVTWSDFDAGRFIKTDMIRAGAEAIVRDDFIVVAGYNGCGKTVLCKYLARTYLASNAGAKCFYLQARPGDDLRDELDIFQSQLSQPGLFIIDDAQFSEESVKSIAQAYVDLRLTKSLAAKLVIATTETSYSPAQREGRTNPLDEAHHLKFDFLSADTMQQYLAAYRTYRPCDGKLAASSIVSIAGGDNEQANMGVALVLAHAVDLHVAQVSQPLSLESERVRTAVARWLASILQLTYEEFGEDVAPVFTVCSFGLAVGPHFSESMGKLVATGFLEEANDGATPLLRLRPEYSSLAWVISRQNLALHDQIFRRYAEHHHTQTASLAQALSSDDTGRRTLLFLLENNLNLFIPGAETRSADFAGLTTIISSAFRVRPRLASDFIRLCFRHGEEAQSRMIGLCASVNTALRTDVRPLTAFLHAIYRADSIFSERFGSKLIDDERDLYHLITLVRDSPCSLEDTMRLLAAAKNCDIRFGTKLAPEFARTREYEKKWKEVANSDSPALVVRVLGELRAVNRRLFAAARDTHLTEEIVRQWTNEVQVIGPFVNFLSRVRQLSPRIASRALNLLTVGRKGQVASLIGSAASISESTLAIASVSRIDRRIATRLARENFEALSVQAAREASYNNLGSGLMRMRRATTSALARNLSTYASVNQIAKDMQHERRRFDLLGRLLDGMAEIAPDVASEIAGQLDYGDLYSKVKKQSLMNFSHLTRGLHVALPLDKRPQLLSYLRNNPHLSTAFHRSLFDERTLHQIADALSTMASAELSTSDIFRLFGSDEAAFRELVRQRMTDQGPRSYSDLEIANFLFTLALLDPAYSAEALVSYTDAGDVVDQDAERTLQSESVSPEQNKSKLGAKEKLAKRFGDRTQSHMRRVDLAGAGALFQISSAIDDDAAKALLRVRLPEFSRAVADKNLGRHSIFLLGLHNVSRGACLRFMKDVYTPERAETLFQVAQNPRELIQFLYAIQLISVGECRRIGSAFIGGDADNLLDYLEAEVDMSELSRWVMTLASIGQLKLLDVKGLVAECAEYDTRLWALIDSTQAMLSAGISDGADTIVAKILDNVNQIRGVRKLSHCIQLWLKTDYISRQLHQPGMITQLTEVMLPRALDLIAHENDHLCAAFAVGLWLDCGLASSAQQDQLQVYRAYQLKRSQLFELPSVRSVLAASVLRATEDHIAALVSKVQLDTYPVWISGLLQASVDGYVSGGLSAADTRTGDLDQNNIKYGFACYSKRRSHGSLSQAELDELALRKADESSAAIRLLLSPNFDASCLPANPYYSWVYLRRTVLALSFLDWDHEVHRANSAAIFRKRSSPDPSPILLAAE